MNEQDRATPPNQDDEAFAQRFLLQDFSSRETAFRLRLRHQIVAQAQEREGASMRGFSLTRRPALLALAVALIMVLAITASWFAAPRAVAQAIAQVLQSLRIGPFTTADQIAPGAPESKTLPSGRSIEDLGPMWNVDTPIANFGGNLPPNQDPTVQRFRTVEEAQALASFAIRLPAELPAGYALREVALAPMKNQAFLFFDGSGSELVVVETAVGKTEGPSANLSETQAVQDVSVVAAGLMTDKPITPVTFDGRPAAWIEEDGGLWWEGDGLSFAAGGKGLTLNQVMRIAASLK